jgi:citronellol/citronellal dehydrogenase
MTHDVATAPDAAGQQQRRAGEAETKRRLRIASVSAAIVFLLSPAAAFVTGITMQIDGGASLGNRSFPLPPHQRSGPFSGFHRAAVPDVLKGVMPEPPLPSG